MALPTGRLEAPSDFGDRAERERRAQLVLDEIEEVRQMESSTVGEVPSELLDEEELANYLMAELQRAENERQDHIDNLTEWQEAYRAPPADDPKNWPIRDAANLTVPVIKEVVQTLASSLLQTILTPRPRWVLKDLAEEWTPFKHILEKFLDVASRRELDFESKVEDWVLEGTKYGTSILEVGHEFLEKKDYQYTEDGSEVHASMKVEKDGPTLYHVPLQDFFIRFHEKSIDSAQWVAKRIRFNGSQLRARAASGKFRADAVTRMFEKRVGIFDTDDVTSKHEELEDTEPVNRQDFEVFECWISWSLDDGDDLETDLLVYYSPALNEILAARFNPFWHNESPFAVFQYFPVEDRFYGEGVCEMLLDLQQEITTIHNQRLDNAKMANLRMVLAKKMSTALEPGDPLYTGKIIQVNEMDDVMPFQLSEIYPSTINNEQIARGYVERISGVDRAQSVGGLPVTRTTATAQQLLLAEGRKRLDQTIRKLRSGISRTGDLVLSLYFQFGAGDKPILWLGEDGRAVNALFNLPRAASERGIGIEAAAPTSKLNKEAQRQNSLALFNLTVQMYEKILQLTAQVQPQAVPIVAGSLVSGAQRFMFDVLEQFDVTDPEDVLAGLSVLERVLPAPEDMGGLEAFRGREETAQILDELEELEDLFRETGGGGEGRDRVPPVRRQLREVLKEEGVLGGNPQGNGSTGSSPQGSGGGSGAGFPSAP